MQSFALIGHDFDATFAGMVCFASMVSGLDPGISTLPSWNGCAKIEKRYTKDSCKKSKIKKNLKHIKKWNSTQLSTNTCDDGPDLLIKIPCVKLCWRQRPFCWTACSTVQINEMSSSCQTEDCLETLALVTSHHDTLAPIWEQRKQTTFVALWTLQLQNSCFMCMLVSDARSSVAKHRPIGTSFLNPVAFFLTPWIQAIQAIYHVKLSNFRESAEKARQVRNLHQDFKDHWIHPEVKNIKNSLMP